MTHDLWAFGLYLAYGLVFFTMGVAITSKDTRISRLEIARPLWLFAGFAYVHAFNEWLELYLALESTALLPVWEVRASYAQVVTLVVSFGCLLAFGARLLRIGYPKSGALGYAVAAALVTAWTWTVARKFEADPRLFDSAEQVARYLIGFPGGLASGLGLVLYARRVRPVSAKGAASFRGAGLSLAAYAVVAGLLRSRTSMEAEDVQVVIFKSLAALTTLLFLMRALRIFDVEQLALMEEKLQRFARSEKMSSLGKLAAGIAHEINNPLANASMNVEMLKAYGSAEHPLEWEKRLTAIERNVDRASKIAQELLFFSRNRESDFLPTNVNEVIESTITLLGEKTRKYDLQLQLEAVGTIRAIPWKLEEVFLNVLINAIEAMPDGGTIRVRTTRSNGDVVVEVSDSGPGVPQEILPHVFDPFFTTKEPGQGTGLGLSVCFSIVELHGGRIELKSDEGRGTSVRIVLPGGSHVAD